MANVNDSRSNGASYEDYDYIESDFTDIKKKIENKIANTELRQQELQNYIADLDSNIQYLRGLLPNEKDKEKNRLIRGAISKNIELLARLYSTYREYEDVKVKYYKIISDDTHKMHHLIAVDIRRIDEKVRDIDDTDFLGVMKEMMSLVSGIQKKHDGLIPLSEDVQKEMEKEDEAYKL
jgi:hypothetical protein